MMFVRLRYQRLLWGLGLACLTLAAGCKERKAVVRQEQISLAPTRQESSPFEVAMRFLNSLDQYQPEQVRLQILSNLREWARQERDSIDWIADPMFRRLPSDLKNIYTVERLATNEFEPHDSFVLQEAVWLRDVAMNVATQPLYEPHLQEWLADQLKSGELLSDQTDDLSLAYRLFDWTIRNLQLDPEFEEQDLLAASSGGDRQTPLRHVYYPWENLLYGHGDWKERSRVFILLARQLGIHAVMLMANRGDDEPAQPWLPAVLIGERLYLFDPLLGIPLPDLDGRGIAQLANYVDHPELLDALNAEGDVYRIGRSDLENLVAAVDATPAALSQRMEQVESRLTGDEKMVLTVKPTPLARVLREHKHINNVEIWTLPYRGYEFLSELGRSPNRAATLINEMRREQRPFETRSALRQGRLLHLRGLYRGDADYPGATKHYMDARISKQQFAAFNVPLDRVPPTAPILAELPADPLARKLAYEQRMRLGRELALWSKEVATHWLGMVSFEKHEFRVAADYFRRVLEAERTSVFRQSATYNLARALEAMGVRDNNIEQVKEAIALLEGDTSSPQSAGNQLRAARLNAWLSSETSR